MKKTTYIILALILFSTSIVTPALAVTKTPTPTTEEKDSQASESAELKTIERIKEMVADKVSKLNLVEKRGIVGTVTDTSTTQIVVQDLQNNKRFIDIDELTKFQESIGSSKTFGVSDIKKGDRLGFVGLYNKDTERLLARFVTKTEAIPKYVHGVIGTTDAKEFTVTVVDKSGKKIVVDIERSTTTKSYDEEDGLQKSGFSQLEVGEKIMVVGFDSEDEKDRVSASRIIHFVSNADSETETSVTPTTTRRASPTPRD